MASKAVQSCMDVLFAKENWKPPPKWPVLHWVFEGSQARGDLIGALGLRSAYVERDAMSRRFRLVGCPKNDRDHVCVVYVDDGAIEDAVDQKVAVALAIELFERVIRRHYPEAA